MSQVGQIEWTETLDVGRGQVRGRFQLLAHPTYALLKDLLSEMFFEGGRQGVSMKLGRVEEAVILNGVAFDKTDKKNKRKYLYFTHPDVNAGEEVPVMLNGNHPLADAPLVPTDGEFMARLPEVLVGHLVERNPGLLEGQFRDLFQNYVKVEDEEEDDEEGADVPRDPTRSEGQSEENEEDTSSSGPTSGSELLQVQ